MSQVKGLATGGGANRWKFQTFQDRIKTVKIDVIQSAIAHRQEQSNNDSTFAGQLAVWDELNCTAEYCAFANQASSLARSLPMVLYHKEQLIDLILDHLSVPSSNAYEPILSLTISLAKDLRHEFFPYLHRIIAAITPILRLKDPSVIEHGFQCIAYLLRYLQRNVLQNMTAVFKMLAPLLGQSIEQKPYIRQFAAESVSFMIRKLNKDQMCSFIDHIFESVDNEDESTWHNYASALGLLMSETVCHVNQTLHSCHVLVLSVLVQKSLNHPTDRKDLVVTSALTHMIRHTNSTTNLPIIILLLDNWSVDPGRISSYLLACISVQQGASVSNYAQILDAFSKSVLNHSCISRPSINLLAQVLLHAEYPDIIKAVSTIRTVTAHPGLPVDVFIDFHRTLIKDQFNAYTSIVLPITVNHMCSTWKDMQLEIVIAFLAEVLSKVPLLHSAASSVITHEGKLIFDPAFPIIDILSACKNKEPSADSEIDSFLIAAITVASHLDIPRKPLESAMVAVLEQSVSSSSTFLFAHTLKALVGLEMISHNRVSELVSTMPVTDCPYLLDALSAYIKQLSSLSLIVRNEWTTKISPFTASFHHAVRRPVMSILAFLYPESNLLDFCSKFEQCEVSFNDMRTHNMYLKNMGTYLNSDSAHVETVTKFALALLSVNFAPLWPSVINLITRLLDVFPERTWQEIADLMVKFQSSQSFPLIDPSIPDLFSLDPSISDQLLHIHAKEQFTVVFDRINYWNIYSLLLKAVSGHVITETKSRFLVPYFFEFMEREYRFYHGDVPSLPIDTSYETDLPFDSDHPLSLSYRLVNKKLLAFLAIFSHFKAAHVHKSDVLFSLYESLLLRAEPDLQLAVLSCINTYNYEWYKPYHTLMVDLVDESKFRNALLSVKLQSGSSGLSIDEETFKPHHRARAFPMALRVLFGRMMCRKGRMSSRRTNILSLMAGAHDSEIQFLFQLMAPAVLTVGSVDNAIVSRISSRKLVGFLILMEDVLKQISLRVTCILDPVVDLLTSIAVSASMAIREHKDKQMNIDSELTSSPVSNEDGDDISNASDDMDREMSEHEDDNDSYENPKTYYRMLVNMRALSLRRIVALFKLGIEHNYEEHVKHLFDVVIEPQLAVMYLENDSTISPALNLLCSWSIKHFDMFRPLACKSLKPMIACLVCFEPVRNMVLDALFSVLQHDRELLGHVAEHLFEQSASLITPKSVVYMSRLIELCSEVSSYLPPALAPLLLPVLLPVLTSLKGTAVIKKNIFAILQSCIQFLPHLDVTNILVQTSRLLATVQDKSLRLQLVELIISLATVLELPNVCTIIRGLNQYHCRRLDELDYDIVLSSFTELIKKHERLQKLEWIPILYNIIHLMASDDLSARGNASHVLSLFVQLAANHTANEDAEYEKLVQSVVYSSFKIAIKSSRHIEQVRSEWIKVLLECVKHLGHMPIFAGMTSMLPKDATDESSFFENLYHVQIHRRQRALLRLRDQISHICPATLNHVFLPLITHTLNHKDPNLVNEAVLTITSITKNLPWSSYLRTLRKFFSNLRADPEKRREKILLRAVVSILNGFHFEIAHIREADLMSLDVQSKALSVTEVGSGSTTGILSTEMQDVEEYEQDHDDNGEQQSDDDINQSDVRPELTMVKQQCKILSVTTNKIIPELNQYLISRKQTDDSVMSVRVPIALGIAHLINWLPEKEKNVQIPSLIIKLAQLLRARLQSTRTATCKTLIEILNLLGPKYLFFMVKELRGALLRGYQVHVLGYTIHAILASVELSPAILKVSANDLCAVVANDIFGDVGKEKDAEDYIKSMKELKSCMSYDSCELIATHADLDTVSKLLIEIKKILVSTRDSSALEKVQKVLKRVTPGFIGNQHIPLEQTMKLIHSLIVDTYSLANADNTFDSSVTINVANTETKVVNASATCHWKFNAHYFVEFGLRLLQACLRSSRICIKNELHMQMLNSMVDVVGQCFQSKHNYIYILACHAMHHLCRMPLSELRNTLPFVITKTFNMIVSLPNAKSDIAQASFKLIHSVMNTCEYIQFTQKHIQQLLRLLRPEIDDQDHHVITYSLLKSIIGRRIVVSEVYEIMLEIGHILVTSHSTNVQDLCRTVYLQFLLNYPQGKQRIDNHISWMVKNLSYQYEQGRVAVLELMHAFIRKLPEDILAEYGEMMFVGLVSLLTSQSTKCQEMAAQVLQCLVTRMKTCISITKMISAWYSIPKTCIVAVQVHGILVLAGLNVPQLTTNLKTVFDNYVITEEIDEPIDDEAVQQIANDTTEQGIETNSDWELIYHAILTLTKLITSSNPLNSISVVSVLQPYLTHPHGWIRMASSRCMGEHFKSITDESSDELSLETVRLLVRSFIRQLQSEHLTPDLATHAVKNLFFLIKRIHKSSSICSESSSVTAEDKQNIEEAISAAKPPAPIKNSLQSTIQFLSFVARKDQTKNKNTLLRSSVFQLFAAISNYLSADDLMMVVHSIMAPIYRTSLDLSVQGPKWDELRQLSEETMELIQTKLGQTLYNQVYSETKKKSDQQRQSRKQHRVELMVTNPQAAIQRKISRNLQKGRQAKRKAESEIKSRIHLDVKRSKTRQ